MTQFPQTTQERTHWRDTNLSERHRRWGWNCPALDIDLLFLEYDSGKAIALIEYKNENAAPQYLNHPSYRALIDLADRATLPAFIVRYADNFSWWRVGAINEIGRVFAPVRATMNEIDYVEFLYSLRGRTCPQDIIDNLREDAI